MVDYANLIMKSDLVYFSLSGSPFHLNDAYKRTIYSRVEISDTDEFVLGSDACLTFTSAVVDTDFTRTNNLFVSVVQEFTLTAGFSVLSDV